MIISQAKPKEELMDFIKDANNVLITGCSLCASTCKVGGEEEIAYNIYWKKYQQNFIFFDKI